MLNPVYLLMVKLYGDYFLLNMTKDDVYKMYDRADAIYVKGFESVLSMIVDEYLAIVHYSVRFHPTTVSYVKRLVTSYVEAIYACVDDKCVKEWINNNFPKQYIIDIEVEIINLNRLTDLKSCIISFLIRQLLLRAEEELAECYPGHTLRDDVALPWDVQISIVKNHDLSKMFHIQEGNELLPVEIAIDGRTFTHMLSCEFSMGLLLFTNISPFTISMFGETFAKDYLTQFRFLDSIARDGNADRVSEYLVTIGGNKYAFKYLQVFIR